jgi:hypothetical protein
MIAYSSHISTRSQNPAFHPVQVYSLIVILINLLVDLLYAYIDPTIRQESLSGGHSMTCPMDSTPPKCEEGTDLKYLNNLLHEHHEEGTTLNI